MCRTAHAVLSTAICGVQMLVRVFMTTILMLENVFRMCLQTLYNFISFMLQLISLVPICCVFLITSRMKCFMCGGGGPCPVGRGGACDCLMSLVAIIILFFIFRATGVLDKIFYSIGYAKATTHVVRFAATTGSITECSRNDTDTEYVFYPLDTTPPVLQYFYVDETETTTVEPDVTTLPPSSPDDTTTTKTNTPETNTEITTENPKLRIGIGTWTESMGSVETVSDVIETGDTALTILSSYETGNDAVEDTSMKMLRNHNVTDIERSKILDWTTVLYYLA